jgi:hypothetical protein
MRYDINNPDRYYAELLEYLHCSNRAADEGCARSGCATRARCLRVDLKSLRRPTIGERVGELNKRVALVPQAQRARLSL